jgi:YD repeat-containing protein
VGSPAARLEHPVVTTELLSVEQRFYNVAGQLVRATDADGVSSCVAYDSYGRIAQTASDGLAPTLFSYEHGLAHPRDSARSGELSSRTTTTIPTGESTESYTWLSRPYYQRESTGHAQEVFYAAGGLPYATVRFDGTGAPLAVKTDSYEPGTSRLHRSWNWESDALVVPGGGATGVIAALCTSNELLPENCEATVGGSLKTLGGMAYSYLR